MKKLPQTINVCGRCPYTRGKTFLEEYLSTGLRCILTGHEIHNPNEIDRHCPLNDVVQEHESTRCQ